MHLDGVILGRDIDGKAMAGERAAEQSGRVGPDAIEGSHFPRQCQQQEGFADTAGGGYQRGLCQREHTFDRPAPGLRLAGKAFAGPPLRDVESASGLVAGNWHRPGQQGVHIDAFGHSIGGIPLAGLVRRDGDPPHLGTDSVQLGCDPIGVLRPGFVVVGPEDDGLAGERRPVGLVDGRGGTAHGGGGDDPQ